MRGRTPPLPAAWLILALQTATVICSGDVAMETKNQWMDDLSVQLMMSRRGPYYQVEPPPLLPPSSGGISTRCQKDLLELGKNIKALDAFGKPGAGFIEGNVAWLGNYDECMSLEGFNYCLADMLINGTMLSIKGVPPVILLRWGTCPPVSCSKKDLMNALNLLLGYLKYVDFGAVTAAGVSCSTSPPIPYSAGVICTIVLLSILGILMITGSLFDECLKLDTKKLMKRRGRWLYCRTVDEDEDDDDDDEDEDVEPLYGREESQPWIMMVSESTPRGSILTRFLLCFAVTRNLASLLDTQQKDTSIASLNGIRVISMTWVILGHTLFFSMTYGATQNSAILLEWLGNFGFQALSNAFFSVDSFFFLSGLLVSYLTLSRMPEMRSAKAWAWFYFHRYWRLTPLLGVVILVWMYIQPYFGDSPIWYSNLGRPNCETYWWTNFLYINNFYPQGFTSQCIGWVWYLANDMQFFVISPLLLLPLYYAPMFGWIALVSVLIVSMAATATIMSVYNASVDIIGVFLSQKNGYGMDDESLIYEKPYCRIAPYLVGIGLGYIMHRIGKRRVRMSPLLAVLGWVVAAGIAISVVYGFYPSYHSGVPVTRAGQVAYGTLSRFAWGIAVAWVAFACKYGYGGWINNFLSWSLWIPLGRLTYSAYLLHPLVFITFYANFGTPVFESKYLTAYYFAGNLLLSYAVALVASLAVEYPFANLEKLFMPNNPKEKRERFYRYQLDIKL